MANITSALFSCFKEAEIFLKKLEVSDNEHVWMNYLDKLESKMGLGDLEILQTLKLLVMSCLSLNGLKHLMHTFLRKVSSLIDKRSILSDEEKAYDTWKVVQNFWSLCSNQHEQLTGMSHGYSAEFYLVLPSLASVYVDLFIAANRSKTKLKKLSKRLYGWLKFELNERCMKTAFLEVSEKTPDGAKILSPILKKLLSQPPALTSDSHLDYLLHFILLKSWLPVCENLKEIAESSLNLKAPETFVSWLKDNWAKSADHLPEDKSFKGRRVSELLLDLDASVIEELFDVFSNNLWSINEDKEKPANLQGNDNLFTIDKKGNESQKVTQGSEKRKKGKKRKAETVSKIMDDDNSLETDYFMLDKSPSEVPEVKRRKIAVDAEDERLSDNPGEEEEAMDFNHSGITESSDHDVAEVVTTPEREALEDLSIEVANQSVPFFLDRGAAKFADGRSETTGVENIEVSCEEISPSEGDQSDESELEILKDDLDVSCLTLKKPTVKRAVKSDEMIDITGEKHDDSLRIVDSNESDDGDVEIMLPSLKFKSSRRNPKDAAGDRSNTGKEIKDRTGSNEVIAIDDDFVCVAKSRLISSPLKWSPMKRACKENDNTEVLITNVEKGKKERLDDVMYVSETKIRPSPLKKSQVKSHDVEKTQEETNNEIMLVSPAKVRPSLLKKSSQNQIFDIDKIQEETNNDVMFITQTKFIPSPLKKSSQYKIQDVEKTHEKPINDVMLVSPSKVRPSPLKKSSQDKISDVEQTQEKPTNDEVLVSPTKVRPSPLKKSQEKIQEVEKTQEKPTNDDVLVSPTKVRPSPLKKSSQEKISDVEKTQESFDNVNAVLVSPTKVRPSRLKKSQEKLQEVEKTQEETNNNAVLVSPTKVRPSPLKKSSLYKIAYIEKTQEETNNNAMLVSPTKVRPSPLKKSSQDKIADIEKTQEETDNDIMLITQAKFRPSPLKKSPSPMKKVYKDKDTVETSTVVIENKVHNLEQDAPERKPTKSVLKEADESDISDSPRAKSDFQSNVSPSKNPKCSENLKDYPRSLNEDEKPKDAKPENVTNEVAAKVTESTPASSQSPVINNTSENKLDSTTLSIPPSQTEQQIDLMLAQMRKSVTKLQEKPSTLRGIKTRLRTKSEIATQPEKKSSGRSEESLSDWLRKPTLNKSQKSDDTSSESPGKTDSDDSSPRKSDQGDGSPRKSNPSDVTSRKSNPSDVTPRKTDSVKKLVSDAVSTRQSPRTAGKSNKESPNAKGNKATPEVLLTRTLRKKSFKDSGLGGSEESTEESQIAENKTNKSPLHASPLTRSYLLRRKQLDGKCVVCSSSDSECSLHSSTAVVTSKNPGSNSSQKTLTRMKLKSSSTQSSPSPSQKRKAATPKI